MTLALWSWFALSLLIGGCHASAPPPVTHENILTVTPNTDATSLTQYNFYRSTNGGAFVLISPAPQFGLTYADTEIVAGEVYSYRATAVVDGVESSASVTVTLTAQ